MIFMNLFYETKKWIKNYLYEGLVGEYLVVAGEYAGLDGEYSVGDVGLYCRWDPGE